MGLLHRLRGRRAREQELEQELQSFLELAEERHLERGLAPEAARRAARLDLGGAEQVKERVRDTWSGAWLDALASDLRYGLRTLRRKPGLTFVAVLTLGLGIGANTAIFSLVHEVLLRPLPYRDSERLALVWFRYDEAGQFRNPGSGPELIDLRERTDSFEGLAGVWSTSGALTGVGDPEQIRVGLVTANFFEVLGASPAIGREFLPEEEGPESSGAIVLSDALFKRRYAGDRTILGRTVQFNGQAITVVGILPPGFELRFPEGSGIPRQIQAWLPFNWDNRTMPRDLAFIRVLGRLTPDRTVEQADEEATLLAETLRGEHARYHETGLGLDVVPLQDEVVREIRPALLALFVGVALVLLIACVNVASLQLGRFATRRREIALRAALGASRRRIVRQLLAESVLLSLLGGAAGLALATVGLRALLRLRPQGLDDFMGVELDATVLGFTLVVSLLTGALFGVAPALESCRVALMRTLRQGGEQSGGPARERFRGALVAAEFALAFLLLLGAGLMMRTLVSILQSDPGFRPGGALTFQISLPQVRYPEDPERAIFVRQLEEDLLVLPGVESVGATSHLPLGDDSNWYGFVWLDSATETEKSSVLADQRAITPGYLQALGGVLQEGRWLDSADDAEVGRVVVIDDLLAETLWPGESALGRGLHLEAYENGSFVPRRAEVVGVVGHIQHHSLTVPVRGQAFLPHPQSARPVLTWVVRATGDPELLKEPVAQRLLEADPELPMARVSLLSSYVEQASAPARFVALLAALFAGVALLLASIGVYGTLAYAVHQRTREIGIRVALGAGSWEVLGLVTGTGLRAAVVGLSLGVLGALALGRSLAALFHGVRYNDPLIYVVVAVVLLGAALLASFIPARRALRVDPLVCLRCD